MKGKIFSTTREICIYDFLSNWLVKILRALYVFIKQRNLKSCYTGKSSTLCALFYFSYGTVSSHEKTLVDYESTSARRGPIRFSEVANISRASGGNSIFSLLSCSSRKLTLHSSSRPRRVSHSHSNFLLAASTDSLFSLSFSSLVCREEHQHEWSTINTVSESSNKIKVKEDNSNHCCKPITKNVKQTSLTSDPGITLVSQWQTNTCLI